MMAYEIPFYLNRCPASGWQYVREANCKTTIGINVERDRRWLRAAAHAREDFLRYERHDGAAQNEVNVARAGFYFGAACGFGLPHSGSHH